MAEDSLADNGLVDRECPAGGSGDERGEFGESPGIDAKSLAEREPQGHDHFFQRGISGPLAQAVDSDIDAPGAGHRGGERVGGGHAQVIMGVEAQRQPRHACCGGP